MSLYLSEAPQEFQNFLKEYRDRLTHLASIKALDIATSLKEVDPLASPPVIRIPKVFLTFPDKVWWDVTYIYLGVPDIVGFESITVGTATIAPGGTSFNATDQYVRFAKGELDPTADVILWGCSFGNSFLKHYMSKLHTDIYNEIHTKFWATPLLGTSGGFTREEFYRRLYDYLFFARNAFTFSSLEAAMNIALGLPYAPLSGTVIDVDSAVTITKGATDETIKVFVEEDYRGSIIVSPGDEVTYGMPLTSVLRAY
ncbi:MAG: hypothetical protein KO464_02190 [Candidatus Methanofastidiosum sp.]|nr:hypothetical protein [Methanofastidiosum sp.]